MRTSLISTIGGPDAISDAFVPGLILLKAPSSILKPSPSCGLLFESPIVGLFGPICTSVKGGGDGSRGELEGETPPRPDPVVMSTSGKQRTRYLQCRPSIHGGGRAPPGGPERYFSFNILRPPRVWWTFQTLLLFTKEYTQAVEYCSPPAVTSLL
jgi:hypothetical protein